MRKVAAMREDLTVSDQPYGTNIAYPILINNITEQVKVWWSASHIKYFLSNQNPLETLACVTEKVRNTSQHLS